MRVHRANIKSALKSTGRERQYVSCPGIVSHEILVQSASTERLKFIVHGVSYGGLASAGSMRSQDRAKWYPRAKYASFPFDGFDKRVDEATPDSLSTLHIFSRDPYFTVYGLFNNTKSVTLFFD